MKPEMDPFTHRIIGAAMEVHRELGPGLLESTYQKCMARELQLQGIPFIAKAKLPEYYKGELIDNDLEMDFYFPNQLVLELKAVERLHPIHEAQLLTYLRLSKTKIGLLMNFNVELLKLGIKRFIL